jgi:hypothetical protein
MPCYHSINKGMIWASVPHYNVRVEGIEDNAKAIVQEVSKIIRMESCWTLEGKRVFLAEFQIRIRINLV